jgi:TonB family protein
MAIEDRPSTAAVFITCGVLAVLIATLLVAAQDVPRIDVRDARKNVGKRVMGCGAVTTHHCPRPQRTTYLDLDTPYWEEGVSVAIPAASRAAFGDRIEDRYVARSICATGRITREDKRFIITVSQPSDLRIDREPQPPPVRLKPSAVRGCDDGVELPQVLVRTKPEYPPAAQAKRLGGIVLLDGVIEADGTVGDVVVVHSLDAASGLDAEAVKAFKSWRFTPGTVSGRQTAVVVGVQLKFDVR